MLYITGLEEKGLTNEDRVGSINYSRNVLDDYYENIIVQYGIDSHTRLLNIHGQGILENETASMLVSDSIFNYNSLEGVLHDTGLAEKYKLPVPPDEPYNDGLGADGNALIEQNKRIKEESNQHVFITDAIMIPKGSKAVFKIAFIGKHLIGEYVSGTFAIGSETQSVKFSENEDGNKTGTIKPVGNDVYEVSGYDRYTEERLYERLEEFTGDTDEGLRQNFYTVEIVYEENNYTFDVLRKVELLSFDSPL